MRSRDRAKQLPVDEDTGSTVHELSLSSELNPGRSVLKSVAQLGAARLNGLVPGQRTPHPGLIALGFKLYGFAAEAARIARDVSEAASYFVSYRLPELYAGIERRPGTYPVQYAGANVPQAWAAGAVLHLMQVMTGLRADAQNGYLHVDQNLPPWLPDVTLQGLSVGAAKVDVRFRRDGDQSVWDATVREGSIEIKQEAWQPWQVEQHT